MLIIYIYVNQKKKKKGACTIVLLAGVQESSRVNNIVTAVNVSLIVFIILFGSFHIEPSNYDDFLPYGWSGVFEGR
jgi:APA family basic amino acid/polyamine antiporter